MVTLARRSSNLNSLWSILYCVLVLVVHTYITYLGVTKYRRLDNETLWGGKIPGELRTYIVLIVLSILFLPLFVFCSLLKVGNTANDGTKLGRDHALDCNTNTLGAKIKKEPLRHIWEKFPPFSAVLQLISAFLVLIPEVVITAAEVKYGVTPSDAVWSSNLDFLFDRERISMSNIIGQSNITTMANLSFYVVPTPRPPVGGWSRESSLHVAFVYLVAGLLVYAVKYSSVFWFTNKVFSALFASQLIFMAVESAFSYSGAALLYKFSLNYDRYQENISTILGPGTVMTLYIFGGFVLLFSTMFMYNYGADYFQEKFQTIDKRHHPEAYRKHTVVVNGSCHGHKTHTFAMVSLVLLAIFKGPIIYDLVSIYRVTKDSLVLSCFIMDVCYMVGWVVLWTVLTLKQQWLFRILDYVPLTQPVFMISNENIVKSASYHGSVDIQEQCGSKKRPSSLPSELTASESGFGDANSSEDERDRFELSLPPLAEIPGDLRNSRRKGSTHSLDRRSRSRRNGNQRVTFHETVKRCTSTDDELYPSHRSRRDVVNITAAEIHRQHQALARHMANTRSESAERCSTPIELEILRMRRPGSRHSIGVSSSSTGIPTLNNDLYSQKNGEASQGDRVRDPNERVKDSNKTERPVNIKDFTIKNDYAYGEKSNLKSSNIQTQTNMNSEPSGPASLCSIASDRKEPEVLSASSSSPVKEKNNGLPNNLKCETAVPRNRLSPRSLEFIDKKHDIGLSRRDSANYSLTSSQETTSNDSDHITQALCSQNRPSEL